MVFLIFNFFLVWTNFQNYKSLFIKVMNHDLWSEDDELELKKVGLVLNDWTLGHKVYFLKFISVFQSPALGHEAQKGYYVYNVTCPRPRSSVFINTWKWNRAAFLVKPLNYLELWDGNSRTRCALFYDWRNDSYINSLVSRKTFIELLT